MGWRIKNCAVVTALGFPVLVPAPRAVPGTSTSCAVPGGRVPHQADTYPVVLSGKIRDF